MCTNALREGLQFRMQNQKFLSTSLIFVLGTLLAGCVGAPKKLPVCDGWGDGVAICDMMNPEDMSLLPRGDWIVVSEMAFVDFSEEADGPPARAGRLTALRVSDRQTRRLFPTEWSESATARPGWGEPECTTPPQKEFFSPHGIDVGRAQNGGLALAVVNHGSREAVEFFEVIQGVEPKVEWRGCVEMPAGAMPNDVALIDRGGFFVTNFMPAVEGMNFAALWNLTKISFGGVTGEVLRWRPGRGLFRVPGSEGSAPNGIEASPDGREIFVAEWGGGAVYRMRLADDGTGTREEVSVDHSPDNLTWTREGNLLVAGQKGGAVSGLRCGSIRTGGCDIGYSVYRIDPETLEATPVREGRGAASVALEAGEDLYIGVFAGDQIERVRIEAQD